MVTSVMDTAAVNPAHTHTHKHTHTQKPPPLPPPAAPSLLFQSILHNHSLHSVNYNIDESKINISFNAPGPLFSLHLIELDGYLLKK